MILHQYYTTFFNLLNFAKFALINLNFLSFFQVAISLSCIFNCIVRSSNSRNGFFRTIRKHHWGWWKSSGSVWCVTIIYEELFESNFFRDFIEADNLHCLAKWTHESFWWIWQWVQRRYVLHLDVPDCSKFPHCMRIKWRSVIRNLLLCIPISIINAS